MTARRSICMILSVINSMRNHQLWQEIENTRIYLRNNSLQDALSQLTQAACFLVEGSCRRRLKIVWIILHCKILEFSSQYVCSFATKKDMFWYEVTNQPNRSMCFICQWLSYIQKCNSNHGRYWHQILRLMLLMFFTFIMGPYMPHEEKLWSVFAYNLDKTSKKCIACGKDN